MGVNKKAPGVRFGVSFKDPDVAAAFRDAGVQLGSSANVQVIEFSKTYAPPMVIGCPALPRGVMCGRAKSRAGTEYIAVSGISWKWSSGLLTIVSIPDLTVGQTYDINLVVVT